MKPLIAKNAKYGFARLIDLACGTPVATARHGRNNNIMDQASCNSIASNIRGIEGNPGPRSHFAVGGLTCSADPEKQ